MSVKPVLGSVARAALISVLASLIAGSRCARDGLGLIDRYSTRVFGRSRCTRCTKATTSSRTCTALRPLMRSLSPAQKNTLHGAYCTTMRSVYLALSRTSEIGRAHA